MSSAESFLENIITQHTQHILELSQLKRKLDLKVKTLADDGIKPMRIEQIKRTDERRFTMAIKTLNAFVVHQITQHFETSFNR